MRAERADIGTGPNATNSSSGSVTAVEIRCGGGIVKSSIGWV